MKLSKINLLLMIAIMLIAMNFSASAATTIPYGKTYSEYGKLQSGKVFVFDPRKATWYAYKDGQLVGSGRASGGRNYCPDIHRGCHTPVGSFRVSRKGPVSCKSSIYPIPYGGAPMGYCMFFTKYYAIHASNDVPPHNASHGCIRVQPGAARWLSQSFISVGTRVIVKPY